VWGHFVSNSGKTNRGNLQRNHVIWIDALAPPCNTATIRYMLAIVEPPASGTAARSTGRWAPASTSAGSPPRSSLPRSRPAGGRTGSGARPAAGPSRP
jgi:hypothetical protein